MASKETILLAVTLFRNFLDGENVASIVGRTGYTATTIRTYIQNGRRTVFSIGQASTLLGGDENRQALFDSGLGLRDLLRNKDKWKLLVESYLKNGNLRKLKAGVKADDPISGIELPVRTKNLLEHYGYNTVGKLIERSAEELLEIKEFSSFDLKHVEDSLHEYGFELKNDHEGMRIPPTASIEELNLGTRAMNCLNSEGIRTVGQLLRYSAFDLRRVPNLGVTVMAELELSLSKYDLVLDGSDSQMSLSYRQAIEKAIDNLRFPFKNNHADNAKLLKDLELCLKNNGVKKPLE